MSDMDDQMNISVKHFWTAIGLTAALMTTCTLVAVDGVGARKDKNEMLAFKKCVQETLPTYKVNNLVVTSSWEPLVVDGVSSDVFKLRTLYAQPIKKTDRQLNVSAGKDGHGYSRNLTGLPKKTTDQDRKVWRVIERCVPNI